jgi:hypothetical protein
MGNLKGLGHTFMHTRQHRTLSPMAKPVVHRAILVVESEKTEDKHRKQDRQSAHANDGQPTQNLRQNIA